MLRSFRPCLLCSYKADMLIPQCHTLITFRILLMPAPYIPGGYTNLLIGVDQDATVQSSVRKLHSDGVSNHENM